MALRLRPLDADTAADRQALRQVVFGAPAYAIACDGHPPREGDVEELVASRPPGSQPSQKQLLGIALDGDTIGCISLVRGWPAPDTAHIGLLLLDEAHQHQGLGHQAHAELEALLQEWPEINRLRVAVVSASEPARRFWQREGYREEGSSSAPSTVAGGLTIMSKPLRPR